MTISAIPIGTATAQLTMSGTDSVFTDFANAVADAITGVNPTATTGWTLYDSFTSGIIFTQVFRALAGTVIGLEVKRLMPFFLISTTIV